MLDDGAGVRAVFLDRDGTIIRHVHHLVDPDRVELLPGAGRGIAEFMALGLKVAVCSNQSVVGRGLCTANDVDAVNARVVALLKDEGAAIDAFFFCPHAPWDRCPCRKPAPGLGLRAAAEFGIAPTAAVVIGDQCSDVGFGRALGAHTVLVDAGATAAAPTPDTEGPDLVVARLTDAATWIAGLV